MSDAEGVQQKVETGCWAAVDRQVSLEQSGAR